MDNAAQPTAVTLSIRPATADDEAFLWSLASDARVTKWVGDGTPWSREYFDTRFTQAMQGGMTTQAGSTLWSVASLETGQPVALLTLTRTDAGVEVGYWVAPDHWGRGIAKQLVAIAIARSEGTELAARAHRDNAASRHVLERAGFTVTSARELVTYARLQ